MMRKHFLFFLLSACLLGANAAAAQSGVVARETAEFLMKRFGKEAAGETVESLSKRVASVSSKFGDEGVEALRKVGPAAFRYLDDAGEMAPTAARLLSRYGDEASYIVTRPASLRAVSQYGDEAAEAILKHKGIATPLIDDFGEAGAKALRQVDPQNARRLAGLAKEGVIATGGRSAELLGVAARFGNRGVAFIWRNKWKFASAAALTAFLADPEGFIEGAKKLTVPMADIVKHLLSQVDWSPVAWAGGGLLGLLGVTGALKGRSKRRRAAA
ncbi:MAG: hypothetical protein AAF555_05025 [Verrucomicrobiota bacterium]